MAKPSTVKPAKTSIPTTAMSQHEARTLARTAITRRHLVKMSKPSKLYALPASVEWKAFGPVTPEFAEAMAKALQGAASAARDLNIPKRAYMDMDNPDGYYGR